MSPLLGLTLASFFMCSFLLILPTTQTSMMQRQFKALLSARVNRSAPTRWASVAAVALYVAVTLPFAGRLLVPAVAQSAPQTPATGTIAGQIRNPDGTPSANVRVAAMEAANSQSTAPSLVSLTQTDSTGRYRLENVPSGRYYIIAGSLDTPAYFPGVAARSGAEIVTVRSAGLTSAVDFTLVLPATARIRGRVVREDNEPLVSPAAERFADRTGRLPQVRLSREGGPDVDATLAADGSFEFPKVLPGAYQAAFSEVNSPWIKLAIVQVDGVDIAGAEWVIPKTYRVQGTVVLETEGPPPLPSFALSFTNANTNAAGPVGKKVAGGIGLRMGTTEGTFTGPSRIPDGEYSITVENLSPGFRVKKMQAGAVDLLREPLKIAGAEPPPITLILNYSPPPTVRVSGRVTGLNAAVLSRGVSVDLIGGTARPLTAAVMPDRSFEFPAVPAGMYFAKVQATMMAAFRDNVRVSVGDKDVVDVKLDMPDVKDVQGRIAMENGGGVPRFGMFISEAHLTLIGNGAAATRSGALVTPSPDGSFTLSLPEGAYQLGIRDTNPAGYTVESFSYGAIDLLKNPITVTASGSEQLRIVLGGAATDVPITISSQSPGLTGSDVTPRVPGQNGVSFPTLIAKVDAEYSEEARAKRIEGTMVMQVVIRSDGTIDPQIHIVRPLGSGLNEKATEALRQWRFSPAMKDGAPVDSILSVEMTFRLF